LALIDAGGGGGVDRIIGNIRDVGLNPERVELLILTHCHYDHIGGAMGRLVVGWPSMRLRRMKSRV